jgi:ATP-dependent protease HslVU (ClpYQ) peptidase subunit
VDIEELSAEEIATKAMKIASSMCVYTNDNYRMEILGICGERRRREEVND